MLVGNVNQITWDKFKECFYTKFFSVNLKDAKHKDFLDFKQGYMTVEEYDEEINMLSCFALKLVDTKLARA